MLPLLLLDCSLVNGLQLLSFNCDLLLKRGTEDLVVFSHQTVNRLFLHFLYLLYLVCLLLLQAAALLVEIVYFLAKPLFLLLQLGLELVNFLPLFCRNVLWLVFENVGRLFYLRLGRRLTCKTTAQTLIVVFIATEEDGTIGVGPVTGKVRVFAFIWVYSVSVDWTFLRCLGPGADVAIAIAP